MVPKHASSFFFCGVFLLIGSAFAQSLTSPPTPSTKTGPHTTIHVDGTVEMVGGTAGVWSATR